MHDERASLPLWPLPLLAGTLPLVAALLAWGLSTQMGLIPACNVFLEGCVSLSRAARHDLPNYVFRSLMLPAATLQALVWILASRWLRRLSPRYRGLAWLLPLGLLAALALIAYGSFLGTEGRVYRWLRHYGTVAYFGCTCLCLLITSGALQRAADAGRLALSRLYRHLMGSLASTLVLLGLVNALIGTVYGPPLKDRIENVTEWWGSLIFVIGFWALALLWRRLDLRVQLRS